MLHLQHGGYRGGGKEQGIGERGEDERESLIGYASLGENRSEDVKEAARKAKSLNETEGMRVIF